MELRLPKLSNFQRKDSFNHVSAQRQGSAQRVAHSHAASPTHDPASFPILPQANVRSTVHQSGVDRKSKKTEHLPTINTARPSALPVFRDAVRQISGINLENHDIKKIINSSKNLKKIHAQLITELNQNHFGTFNAIIRQFDSWEGDLHDIFVYGYDLNKSRLSRNEFSAIMRLRHKIMHQLIRGRQKLGNLMIIEASKQAVSKHYGDECKLSFLKRGDLIAEDEKREMEKS